MTHFYDWKEEYTGAFLAIVLTVMCFSAYWFLSLSEKVKNYFFIKYPENTAWMRYIVFQKLSGFFFMGLVPALVLIFFSDYSLSDFGLNLFNFQDSLFYSVGMGVVIVILNYFATKNRTSQSIYPQMRIKQWDSKLIAINSVAWTAYLLAYEFMFRGFLLIACFHTFGFWPAVAINLAIYSATHIPKGLGETIGTFPYGLLLCFITISTGSIAVSFITHLILALSNDYFSVHHNPEMKFV